jgi:predicted nucleic acid-binding protein
VYLVDTNIFLEILLLQDNNKECKLFLDNLKKIELDFDDSYQYFLSRHFDLTLATMDQDFKKIKDVSIRFL